MYNFDFRLFLGATMQLSLTIVYINGNFFSFGFFCAHVSRRRLYIIYFLKEKPDVEGLDADRDKRMKQIFRGGLLVSLNGNEVNCDETNYLVLSWILREFDHNQHYTNGSLQDEDSRVRFGKEPEPINFGRRELGICSSAMI